MFKHYKRTHLEDYVEELYIQHKIGLPVDITISNIAKSMNIIVEYTTIEALKGASFLTPFGKYLIVLDERRSPQEQRADFLHELGHLLRHYGNQLVLPESFVRYQEEDAEQFVMYALMPFSMIEQMEFSPDRQQAVNQLAETFAVGTELASKRYDQIVRREAEGAMMSETAAAGIPRKEVKPIDPQEPQFMVYYDPSGTLDGPSQMIVILDEWTLMNCREIELPIGGRLLEIDQDEMQGFDGTSVLQQDIVCFDGCVTLQVHELLFRYGLSRRKFVIHMHSVDMLMARDRAMTRRLDW
ncbi:ImmA/IrrE family metallo-endopeptidase [Paenibacillus sp. HN-1]|uniref:ImmA/IrrE family metallo-endopeptidase n=1 Tax=Paenibacillus TaxID=44249 RepID=UPI001CA8DBA8|nr:MULTISPECIES: ImmA/IrrE family metallo-endopeptidase [Paenibacillus]MBY9077244.1 ImmA/IrrE family metallo-endopeptidase [Paenibacillus sp. CGMCC 1.18879]MBY9083291.1 ImmA/IrrE family metallo-endopeptidase [Paenibacillus sinensis]